MTMLASLTVLGLAAGVYGVHFNLTTVDFVVFVPTDYFERISVFVNESSRVDFDVSQKPPGMTVFLFGK